MKKQIRKGVKVRYIGSNPKFRLAWGDSVQRVESKCGNYAQGWFPYPCIGNVVHNVWLAIPLKDLEIVE